MKSYPNASKHIPGFHVFRDRFINTFKAKFLHKNNAKSPIGFSVIVLCVLLWMGYLIVAFSFLTKTSQKEVSVWHQTNYRVNSLQKQTCNTKVDWISILLEMNTSLKTNYKIILS